LILIDAHVHLWCCFQVSSFLNEAIANFEHEARRFGREDQFQGVLCVVDPHQEQGFGRLLEYVRRRQTRGLAKDMEEWRLQGAAEDASICLSAGSGKSAIIISGRQIASEERLEVLALGTRQQFEDSQPARTLLQKVARAGAIPVLPWGVGKWLGRRGQLVEELIEDPDLPPFFLGDSAHRPTFWPQPSQFRRAEEQGIKNLSGSDPLPFPREVQRAGSFGVVLDGSLNLERPAQDLKQKLLDPSTTFRQFGEGEAPARFVRNQLKMQFRKLIQ
jgi:hypothetical protein